MRDAAGFLSFVGEILDSSDLKITDEFCHSWPPLIFEMFEKLGRRFCCLFTLLILVSELE